jgi:hypothetical protein
MTPATVTMTWFWQAWLAVVVFIFPIPHTIALRNVVLLIGLLALLATLRRAPRPPLPEALIPAAWALLATTTWLVLHSFAVAPAPTIALDNLRGDWIVPLLTAVLAAFIATQMGLRRALLTIISALLAHMLLVLGWQLWLWFTTGRIGDGSSGLVPFGERDYQSSLSGFLFALLFAERLAVLAGGRALELLPTRLAWAALAVALLADLALRTRNGTVVSLALFVVAACWLARQRPRFLLLLMAGVAVGGASLAIDHERWNGLKESLSIGWNSPSLYWLKSDPALLPSTSSGAPPEYSAYLRAALAQQAVQAIVEHPLGLGFGRDGFGRAVELKYGDKGLVSSHSGWLDFALGTGLPGLALLLLTAGLAIRGGWRQFRQHEDAAGLMFSFLVGSYLLRCLLDGHLSGWRLGLFAFLCGVLVAAMKDPRQKT